MARRGLLQIEIKSGFEAIAQTHIIKKKLEY